MSNFNAQPNQLQSTMHVSSSGGMLVSGVQQNPSIVTGSYSVSSQSSLNVVGVAGQMSLLSSLGQAHQISNQGVYLRQGQITSNNIIMRSAAPSPVNFGATHSPGVLLRSPAPTLSQQSPSPLRSPAPYLTPSPSPSIPPSPSPGPITQSPNHSYGPTTQSFQAYQSSLDAPTATLVGSNNFPLNIHSQGNVKKSVKRIVGKPAVQKSTQKTCYQQVTSLCGSNTSIVGNSAVSPKHVHKGGGGHKASSPHMTMPLPVASPNSQNNMQAKSPVASPNTNSVLRTPTTQPILQQAFQQVPVMSTNNQLVQIIQGSQLIGSRQQVIIPSTTQSQNFGTSAVIGGKQKPPQQILPKPTNTIQTSVPSSQNKITKTHNNPQHQTSGQIILPGNMNNQPLLLNQMPVLVQQNTAQGVQLILRPPVPPSTPGLLIHNARPQMHQPQQLLRILNGMQIAAPTFIVSSQQNMQQNISLQQHIQSNIAQGQIKSAASNIQLSNQNVQQQRQLLNSHIISQNVSSMNNTNLAHLQNLQINGNLAHIQVPNGLNGQFISQIPAQFQTNLAGLSSITTNMNDLHQFSNTEIQTSKANVSSLTNVVNAPSVLQQKVVVPTSSMNQVNPLHDQKQTFENTTVESNNADSDQSYKECVENKMPSRLKKNKKTKKVKGKLDLANLMKLSGIMEDDDLNFIDSNLTNSNDQTSSSSGNIPNEQIMVQVTQQSSNTAQHDVSVVPQLKQPVTDDVPIMITIPSSRTETSYSLSEGEDTCNTKPVCNVLENSSQASFKTSHSNVERLPYMITIQNSVEGNTEPYTISVPNLVTNAVDSLESDNTNDHLNSTHRTQNKANSDGQLKKIDSSSVGICVPSFVHNALNSTVITPTLQSQINEIQNHLMGFTSQNITKPCNNKRKIVKKPVKKSDTSESLLLMKKQENPVTNTTMNTSDPSQYLSIPSQIGNIQISQVDNPVSVKNGQNVLNRNIDNHIQIMPIIENSVVNNGTNTLNQSLSVPYSTASGMNIPVDQTNVPVEWMNPYNMTRQVPSQNTFSRVNQSDIAVNALLGITAPEGFVGGLSLSLSEDGRIVLHQDNRGSMPDVQSQLVLHNLISNSVGVTCEGSQNSFTQSQPVTASVNLPNVAYETIKHKPVTNCVNSVTSIATPKITTKIMQNSHQNEVISQPQNMPNYNQRKCVGENAINKTTKVSSMHQHSLITSEQAKSLNKPIAIPLTKLVELPKIGPNQQLFSLNTDTDQITQLNPSLTTAALGPTEQLLIVPTGINAEQLAQCLLQGQIHFNNISGVPSSNSFQNQNQNMQDSSMRQTDSSMEAPHTTHSTRAHCDNTNKEAQTSQYFKTDEYKEKSKRKCKAYNTNDDKNMKQINNVKTALHDHISSKQMPVRTLEQNICQKGSASGSTVSTSMPFPCHAQVPPLVNVSVQNQTKPVDSLKHTSGPCLPQLIPIPAEELSQNPTNFIPRIQTIQLTPQKQQLLKNVQVQIQALSAKLQNKNSLANLSIPILDGVTNTTSTTVQPTLTINNLSLSDSEIHLALQSLFIEQQKILATGKVIPTIPGQHANFQISDNSSKPIQPVQNIPISQAQESSNHLMVNQKESLGNRWEFKPSHSNQPCTSSANIVAQSASVTSVHNNSNNPQIKNISSQTLSPNFINKNTTNRLSSPYNVQMCTQMNTPIANNTHTKLQLQPSGNIRIIKQPISRSSLFEQQLSVDQAGAINPDVHNQFLSKSDSCKRLIRYHCLNTPIEVESDVSEEIFELRGRHFLNKFQGMVNKYQQLLMKESMRYVQTSELMMIDRMFVAEEQQELERLRREFSSYNIIDPSQITETTVLNNNESKKHISPLDPKFESNYKVDVNLHTSKNVQIDNLVLKKDPDDFMKSGQNSLLTKDKTVTIKSETDTFSDTSQTEIRKYAPNSNSPQAVVPKIEAIKNENIDPFDIESEIMPSFIMKKCETSSSDSDVIKSDISNLQFGSSLEQVGKTHMKAHSTIGLKLNEESKNVKIEQLKVDSKSESYDEWFCIQKELGYIQDKLKHEKKSSDTHSNIIDSQMNDIFHNKSDHIVNALFDQTKKSMTSMSSENNQMVSRIENRLDDIFKDDSKLFDSETGISVETKLEALFHGTTTNTQQYEDKNTLEKSTPSCDGVSALPSERNFGKTVAMNAAQCSLTMSSPKRPWNGEVEYPKRHCVSDENKKLWIDNAALTTHYDNSKRLWNGDGIMDSKRIKHDMPSNQKPKKNILHDLERDLLGLDHIDNNLNSSLASNFDEDINAQVQSAIDSILNLQSGGDATGHQLFMPGSESCVSQFLLEPQEHQVTKKILKPQSKVHEENAQRLSSPDTGLDEAVKSILKS